MMGTALLMAACDCGDDPLATLTESNGNVRRDFAASMENWQDASTGDTFELGDGLRTGEASSATLMLAGGARMALESETLIRLRRPGEGDDAERVEVLSGEVVVEMPEGGDLDLALELGDVRLEGGSQARVRADSSLEIVVGRAVIERPDGRAETLGAGEVAVVEAEEPVTPEPVIPQAEDAGPPEDAGEEDAGEDSGEEDTGNAPTASGETPATPGPARADLLLPASSVVVHAPSVPITVAVASGECEGEAVLRAGRRRALAVDGEAHLSLPAGRHRWSLSCDGRSVSQGRVRVLRDAGRRRMPRIPPRTVIDVDGRPYRVLYQNQLPEVIVRWRDATGGAPYRITVQRPGGSAVTRTASSPRFEFDSGDIAEGTHAIQVRSASGSTSPTTRLSVRFDNAAPTASVQSPESGSFSAGSTVEVAGIAARGWRVRAGGQALSLDGQFRFSATVQVPAGRDSLVLELAHARHGTHYYLRRAAGTQ